jgi:hypothetical protein
MEQMIPKKRVWIFLLALAFVAAFSGVMEMVGRATLDKRKELEQSRDVLKENSKVADVFGALEGVEYIRRGSKVQKSGTSIDGVYAFKVTGAKRTGEVLVRWKNVTPSLNYVPTAIILPGNFADDTVLWTP